MPVMGRSKSAKKPSPLDIVKDQITEKQTHIDSLNNEIKILRGNIDLQSSEEERLKRKLHIIVPEILAHRDREKFPIEPFNDVIEVDAGYIKCMVQQMIGDLRGRQSMKSLIEERLEQLENRIIEQNKNYQSILRKNLSCMKGIEEAMKCTSAYEIKYIIRRLKQELLLEEPMRQVASAPSDMRRQPVEITQLPPQEHNSPYTNLNLYYLQSMETVNVPNPRPMRKYSGDTHIKNIIPELHHAICTELSTERPTRGDWRHFAHLTGISTETILFWRRLELDNPMGQVLNFWKDSQGSDVRLLHRILLSPQIKAYRLAKLVSEFYNVD